MVTGLAAVLIVGAVTGGLIAWDPQGVRDDESWLRAGEEGW